MSYVDLHLHLLPGVDDGAPDEVAALRHARRLSREGVRRVVVTPHISPNWPLEIGSIAQRTEALARAIDAEQLGVRVSPGGEIHPDRADSLTGADLAAIAQGPPGGRWVLLEAPFAGLDERFSAVCERLRARGYGLVIAHPERAEGLLENDGLALLSNQLAAGDILQVNVCSLLGNHGLAIQQAAVHLLRTGLAYLIASDGHPGSRDQTLRLGFDLALRAGASSVQAWRLTQANPRFLMTHGIPQSLPARAPAGVVLARD